MKAKLSTTPGLCVSSAAAYYFMRGFHEKHKGLPVRWRDVTNALFSTNHSKTYLVLRDLTRKHFVKRIEKGHYIALEPPHAKVIQETCVLVGVTYSDIVGPAKTFHIVRARRIICRRLRKANYTYAAIGRLINRHSWTAQLYADRELRTARNLERCIRARSIRFNFHGVAVPTLATQDVNLHQAAE